MADELDPPKPSGERLNFSLGYKFISLLLLLVIAGMFYIWKPWSSPVGTGERTTSVTGEATIKAEPDQFSFNPTYTFKNSDKAAALKDMIAKSDEVVSKLKGLGVEDRNIKTNASGYDYERYYYYDSSSKESSYQLSLSVTANKRDKAQKVEDYLVTTSPSGAVSPSASFSDALRKSLEKQARDLATKEAKSKADQSAKNLGFRLGAVKSVQDGTGFGNIVPMMGKAAIAPDLSAQAPQLTVQPGENELSYSVTVVYFLK